METLQGSTLQSLVAVQSFLDTHQDKLGSVAISGSRRKLDDLVAQLANHATVQQGSTFAVRARRRPIVPCERRCSAIT